MSLLPDVKAGSHKLPILDTAQELCLINALFQLMHLDEKEPLHHGQDSDVYRLDLPPLGSFALKVYNKPPSANMSESYLQKYKKATERVAKSLQQVEVFRTGGSSGFGYRRENEDSMSIQFEVNRICLIGKVSTQSGTYAASLSPYIEGPSLSKYVKGQDSTLDPRLRPYMHQANAAAIRADLQSLSRWLQTECNWNVNLVPTNIKPVYVGPNTCTFIIIDISSSVASRYM